MKTVDCKMTNRCHECITDQIELWRLENQIVDRVKDVNGSSSNLDILHMSL